MNSFTDISGRLEFVAPDVITHVSEQLIAERGQPLDWRPAPRCDNLASAVIDAVMTPRISRKEVERVLERYRVRFPDAATSSDLSQSFALLPLQQWRDEIGTRHRTYAHIQAPYKVDVIAQAAHLLAERGVHTRRDLRERAHDDELRAAWCLLPGQHSGSSWRHLLLVSGFTTPMVCPLTRRFIRRAVKPAPLPTDDDILMWINTIALTLDTDAEQVDHQMWRAGASAPRPPSESQMSV